ncbi:MAG: hypothetical protein ACF8XB_20485 [Planctomycetota bacterium JB042]
MSDPRVVWTVRGFAGGFALGLILALAAHSRPEVALLRGLGAAAVLSLVGLLAAALNRTPPSADDGDGVTP